MPRKQNKVHLIVSRTRGDAADLVRLACGLSGTRSRHLPSDEIENFIGDRIYQVTECQQEADCARCRTAPTTEAR